MQLLLQEDPDPDELSMHGKCERAADLAGKEGRTFIAMFLRGWKRLSSDETFVTGSDPGFVELEGVLPGEFADLSDIVFPC